MEPTPIYKIAHTQENNDIKQIYVFYGNKLENNMDDLFVTDSENKMFKGIFSNEELIIIREKDIKVTFINKSIYSDDTIEVIKEKILQNCGLNTSFSELYLFAQQTEHLNALSIYKILTQNEKLELTRERLVQYLLNIDKGTNHKGTNDKGTIDLVNLVDKATYTYDDIIALGLDNVDVSTTIPIGQKFVALDKSIQYTVNPFSALAYDVFLERYAQEITSTSNSNILMNVVSSIINNMLYVCLAEEVLNYTISKGFSQESTIKIYFPYLLKKSILSLNQLQERKQELLVESEKLITKEFEKNNEIVTVFYDIYLKQHIKYIEKGSREIEFIIHPEVEFNLPLDIVFKLIHSTREVPLIKYNPAKKQDKLYRLYADKIATNGKKIPYLDKSVIFKLSKTIGKTKRVSVYIEYRRDDTITPIVCDFENNGSIRVSANFVKSHSVERLNEILKEAINPVIEVVKNYLSQNGYNINLFNGMNMPNIELVLMDYVIHVPITKTMKLKPIMGCVSSVFNIMSDDLKNGIVMRFKRVANYNEMDSIDAFITEMLNREHSEEDIVEQLVSNYKMTQKKAEMKMMEFVNALQVVQDAFQNRRLKIKNNPGFLTTIHQEPFSSNIIITMNGINNMSYLNTIPIYLESFIQLTQQNSNMQDISQLCKGSEKIKESYISDIVSSSEQMNSENKQMNIVAQELVFETIDEIEAEAGANKDEELFDLFFGDAEGEGEVEAVEGEVEAVEGEVEAVEGEVEAVEGEVEAVEGGAKPKKSKEETLDLDITGKRLTHPNPFQDRIAKRDPNIFSTYKDENFKDYSRSCPWSNRRHPVILSEEEKAKIDEEHPGSYDKESAIKYGSDKDKQFWYICPRYWSLKDNTTLTDEDVASGKYGKVIPKNGKKVEKGEAIFEFNDDVYHKGKNGEYGKLYPGFLKPSAQGKCLPCCFKEWENAEQSKRRAICASGDAVASEMTSEELADKEASEVDKEPSEAAPLTSEADKEALTSEAAPKEKEIKKDKTPAKEKKKTNVSDDYIKGPDKYPLEQNRYGFLPLAIQKFLQTDNKKCQISLTNTNLKPDHICMVRRGVEFSKSQSFIACISNIYTGIYKLPQQTIAEFKETLISAMDIDIFLSLQNGNLINIFAQDELIGISGSIIDINEFKESTLFKRTANTSEREKNTLIKIAHAFNNFKEYLRDNTIEIDYVYLWDLICQPNNKLFKKGLNLAIVEMNNNDITNNVSLVCPSNHYATTFFDDYKDTVIIIKHEKEFDNKTYNLYEPIYAIEERKREFAIIYGFKLNSLVNINETIELIKQSYGKCGTYPSMPKVYEFKRNISLERLVDLLDLKSYTIEKQVMNFNGKVIGVVAKKMKKKNKDKVNKGFIPCFPSAFIKHLDTGFIWMDDDYSDTYENTLSFLNMVYKDLNGRIPCKPKIKVVEDELIVGIITETNQFIMISQPVPDTFLNADLLTSEDMGIITLSNDGVDKDSMVDIESESIRGESIRSESIRSESIRSESIHVPGDAERITYINNIRLESKFYNLFRNSARILLGLMRYRGIKDKIEEIINSPGILYFNKLKAVDELLRDLMKNSIQFTAYKPELLMELLKNDLSNCNTLNKDQCAANKFCLEKQDGSCALVIPKRNLMNDTDNDIVYFGKLSDELIRYNRIKSFIFQQNVFLSFTSVKYNLNANEIILLQSLLTQEYFEGLIVAPTNAYIKNNTYDTAQPLKSQQYSNEISPEYRLKEFKCPEPTSIMVTSTFWKPIFPEHSIEIIFHDSPALCTFDIIMVILKNSKLSKHDLKEILVDEYMHYYSDYKFEIIQILKLQGKHKIAKQLIYYKTTLPNIIMSEDYYATNMDIWLLAKHFKLPIVFFSGTGLVENGKKFFVANADGSDSFYFIHTPGIKNDVANSYRMVAAPKYNDKLPLSALKKDFADSVKDGINENSLEDYLSRVSLLNATKKLQEKKVKVKMVMEEEPVEAVEAVPIEAILSEPNVKGSKKKGKKLVLTE